MGGASKVAEPVGDYLCKKIAVQVQNDLDEYMVNNPEFPVCLQLLSWSPSSPFRRRMEDLKQFW
jgi:hypothetical protein